MPGVVKIGNQAYTFTGGSSVELSSGFDLAIGTRWVVGLPGGITLDDLRWIAFAVGDDADTVQETQRVRRAQIRAVPTSGTLYVANANGNLVELRTMNPTDGTLAAEHVSHDFKATVRGLGMTYHAGVVRAVVGFDSVHRFYTVDTVTGQFTQVGNDLTGGVSSVGLASLNGVLYGATFSGLHTIDVSSGTLTLVESPGVSLGQNHSLGMGEVDGTLYVGVDTSSVIDVYTADPATGAFTSVANNLMPGGSVYLGIGITGHNGELLFANAVGSATQVELAVYDTENNSLSTRGSAQTLAAASGISLFSVPGGPPYTRVSDYFVMQKTSAGALQMNPLRAGRVHSIIGIE